MSDPEKNYHLEFVTRTAPLADRLYELLEALSLPAKKLPYVKTALLSISKTARRSPSFGTDWRGRINDGVLQHQN